MKKTQWVAIVALAVFGSSVFAVGFFGTPTAEIGQGKWSIGYDYSYSSQDTDKTRATFEIVGVSVDTFTFSLKDAKLHRHYATIGYGITEKWDVYVKLGVADLNAAGIDHDLGSRWSMDFDNSFAWGWGSRYTFFKQDNMTWGASAQMNWIDTDVKQRVGGDINTFSVDSYDILISAGPTFDFQGFKVYGGPFYYYLNGDYEAIYQNPTDAIEIGDMKADRNWGGFIGSVIEIANNINLTIEYSTTGKGWGFGTGIAWKF